MGKATEKYQAFKKEYEAVRERMLHQSKSAFAEMAKDLFAENPELHDFAFLQYTDYFNDGEECYFHVHTEWGLNINGHSVDDDDDDEEENSLDIKQLMGKIGDFLEMFDRDVMKDMFGDHVRVTVYSDGRAETESYTHHD